MKMNVKIIALASAALVAIALLAFYRSATTLNRDETFVVGMTAGYAPFVSINERGEYEGFDIDVAQALADKMGKKLVLKDVGSMTSLFMALDQGSIDGIIWALSITQDRLSKVAMVHYQGDTTTSYPLIFWKEIPAGITSLADMNGKTIAVEPTSAQSTVLEKYKDIVIHPTEKVDDALLTIQYGKADAAFVEPAIAKKFQKSYPEIKVVDIQLTPEDQVLGMGIAVKRGNTPMLIAITRAVTELKIGRVIQTLENKWGIE